jgi:hypothetical protein
MKTVTVNEQEFDFDAVVNLMDDDIREQLHADMAPCEDQDFVDAYTIAHQEKFGEEFVVN